MKRNKFHVSKFDNCKSIYSSGIVDLWEWIFIRNKYTQIVERIRMTTDEKERKNLKEGLPAITVSCICRKRDTSRVHEHTGLICIDIDGKDNPNYINDINKLKSKIFDLDYIMYCGLSASGNGLFCIIQIADTSRHKEHFYALEKDFYDIGIVIDSSCKDLVRLRYYSFDENPIFNESAKVYIKCVELPRESNSLKHEPSVIVTKKMSLRDQLLNQRFKTSGFGCVTPIFKSKTQQVKELITLISDKKIDITTKWKDWFTICCVIQNLFGEDGRELFHKVSCFYDGYTISECDLFYSSILKKGYRKRTDDMLKIASFYNVM